jgi:hypothetical protein
MDIEIRTREWSSQEIIIQDDKQAINGFLFFIDSDNIGKWQKSSANNALVYMCHSVAC